MKNLKKHIIKKYSNIHNFSKHIGVNYKAVLSWINHGITPQKRIRKIIMEKAGFDIYDFIKPEAHYRVKKVLSEDRDLERFIPTKEYHNLKEYVEDTFIDVPHASRVLGIPYATLYKVIRGDRKISVELTTKVLKESHGRINLAMFPESEVHEFFKEFSRGLIGLLNDTINK